MSFSDITQNMDLDLLKQIGDGQSLYDNRRYVWAMLEKNIERISGDGVVYFNAFEITTLNSEVVPEIGKTFKFADAVYVVADIVERDKSITTCSVRL